MVDNQTVNKTDKHLKKGEKRKKEKKFLVQEQ
jgi:hypothetical protein